MKQMFRTQLYLPHDLHERLRERADQFGVSMAEQIREAIRIYLDDRVPTAKLLREDDPIWSIVAASEGPSDLSAQHDHYVYGEPKAEA